jgi:hypothetical protein
MVLFLRCVLIFFFGAMVFFIFERVGSSPRAMVLFLRCVLIFFWEGGYGIFFLSGCYGIVFKVS